MAFILLSLLLLPTWSYQSLELNPLAPINSPIKKENQINFFQSKVQLSHNLTTTTKEFADIDLAFKYLFDNHKFFNGVKVPILAEAWVDVSKYYSDCAALSKGTAPIYDEKKYLQQEDKTWPIFQNYKELLDDYVEKVLLKKEEELDPSEYLEPESDDDFALTFLEISNELEVGISMWDIKDDMYKAAHRALVSYRAALTGNAAAQPLTDLDIAITVVGASDTYRLSLGGVNTDTLYPMASFNKLAFYGSYRPIGQWCTEAILRTAARKIIKLDIDYRSALGAQVSPNNLHVVGIGRENSYVATPYYGEGKPYAVLTGRDIAIGKAGSTIVIHGISGNIHHLNPTRAIGFAAYDEMLGDSNNGVRVCAEANFYRAAAAGGYSNGLAQVGAGTTEVKYVRDLANKIEAHIQGKITVDGFINCYRLIVGAQLAAGITNLNYNHASIPASCNLRVFELFTAVVIAEVHRNTYTAIVNAAMLDLFKTPKEKDASAYAGDFYEFFGEADNTELKKHNMAFSGATSKLAPEAAIAWYAAKGNQVVTKREKALTKSWLRLLHNYECWLLTFKKLDGIANGGGNYDGTTAAHRKTVNFDKDCKDYVIQGKGGVFPEADWAHLRLEMKIYAAYQVAKHLNNWNHRDNTHNVDIANKLSNNNPAPDNLNLAVAALGANAAIYTSITTCIRTNVITGGGCLGNGLPANNGDDINNAAKTYQLQEVCLDILCGLLQENYLNYQ